MVLTAGFCQFVYDITFERGVVYDIEFAGIAFEHRESVMVFGGEYDILHTCIFGSQHQFLGIEVHGIEGAGFRTIFTYRYFATVHNPFRTASSLVESVVYAAVQAVRSPVHEHAEFGIAPPGHFLVMFKLFGQRLRKNGCGES